MKGKERERRGGNGSVSYQEEIRLINMGSYTKESRKDELTHMPKELAHTKAMVILIIITLHNTMNNNNSGGKNKNKRETETA